MYESCSSPSRTLPLRPACALSVGGASMTDLAESVLQVMDGDDQLAVLLGVLERVSEPVGRPGRLSQRMTAGVWAKSWSISVDSVNDMIHASCARPARCNGSSVPWRTATSARRPQ
jgi:hypothetical protein